MTRTALGTTSGPADLSISRSPSPAVDAGSTTGPDERFRALFEHAAVGVALCQTDGRFTDVNSTFRELLLGTGIDPLTGSLLDLVQHAPDGCDEARAWRDGLAAVVAETTQVARAQLSVAPPDARPRWVRATAALVRFGEHVRLLTHLEDVTDRRLEEQRLVHLATHDSLTGLANRALTQRRLTTALERARADALPAAVVHLALDGDRDDRDTESLLVAVAERLSAVTRAGDTVGRLGGGEFLVIACDVSDDAALAELVLRLESALSPPVTIGEQVVPVVASLGAVLSRPRDGAATVQRRAEAARYGVQHARRRAVGPRWTLDARARAVDPVELAIVREQAAVAEQR